MTSLPIPNSQAQAQSRKLSLLIQQNILKAGGWISFFDFMQLALYAPGLGYYSAGSQKFGDSTNGGGDFVTAPEISPLFAQTISNQIVQVLQITNGNILELGAGTGKFSV
jgi:SAM-dependent MidA family methyltransferase